MSMYILIVHEELMWYVETEQGIRAGNVLMLSDLMGRTTTLKEDIEIFLCTRNMRIPFASAPGVPRGAETDRELYKWICYYEGMKEGKENFQKRVYAQIKDEPEFAHAIEKEKREEAIV